MIFIVGYTFTVGRTEAPTLRGGSVMQQLNENRNQARPDPNNPLNFGSTYKLVRIKPVLKDKKLTNYEYQFADLKTGKVEHLVFSNSEEADVLIARLSGKLQEYKQLKEQAARLEAII